MNSITAVVGRVILRKYNISFNLTLFPVTLHNTDTREDNFYGFCCLPLKAKLPEDWMAQQLRTLALAVFPSLAFSTHMVTPVPEDLKALFSPLWVPGS